MFLSEKDRLGYLDFLRGIAIIFVVMGHFIQYNLEGMPATQCFNFIYAFHMGFFFFISGCSAALSANKNTLSFFLPFVRKKAIQLLVPFFIWGGVVFLSVKTLTISNFIGLPQRLLSILRAPCLDAPWFLFSLFFIQLVFFLCCSLCNQYKKNALSLAFILSAIIIHLLQSSVDSILGILYPYIPVNYLLLFYLGYQIDTSSKIRLINTPFIVLLCFIIFIIVTPHFNFFSTENFCKIMLGLISSVSFSLLLYLIIKFKYERISSFSTQIINYLGRNTLEIYVTHYSFIIVFSKPWLNVSGMNSITLFLLVMIVAIILSFIAVAIANSLKTIPYLGFLLYGK